jgi:hypothetical protein
MIIISKKTSFAVLWWLLAPAITQYSGPQPQGKSGFEHVDPLIGTINGGGYDNRDFLV